MSYDDSSGRQDPQDTLDMCMDWGDAIESDGGEFPVLEEGDYNFVITNYERGRYPGSAKIPACNKASITASVRTGKENVSVRFDLILCRTLEWRLSSFFRCIGQKRKGKVMVMDWSKVPGSRGRARFVPRTYINKYGEEKTANEVSRFYDYDPEFFKDEPPAGFTELAELSDDGDLPF